MDLMETTKLDQSDTSLRSFIAAPESETLGRSQLSAQISLISRQYVIVGPAEPRYVFARGKGERNTLEQAQILSMDYGWRFPH